MVERPLAHHFKILGRVTRGFLGVLRIEGVSEARAFDRLLLDAIHGLGGRDAGDFEERRHHVDHMDELLPQRTLVLDAGRPRHNHVLVDAAKPRGVLLEPVERRVKSPRPTGGHVVVGFFGAPGVIPLHLDVNRHLVDAVKERDFVRVPSGPPSALVPLSPLM